MTLDTVLYLLNEKLNQLPPNERANTARDIAGQLRKVAGDQSSPLVINSNKKDQQKCA